MSRLLLLDAIEYLDDNSLVGVEVLQIPMMRSFGLNNASANRKEIIEIVRSWETDGLGAISTAEQSQLYFTFNEKARLLAYESKINLNRVSFSDKLASDKFQKIGNISISFLSFIVSIGALIVAITALNKAP